MPELPDVEVYRRRLAGEALHRDVAHVETFDASMLKGVSRGRLGEVLVGRRLEATRRHGKHLFARTAGEWVVFHFGMTGRLERIRADDELPEHARFTITFADGSRLVLDDQRRLGYVALTSTVEEYVAAHGLGEDALQMSESYLRDVLAKRQGGLKSALMNQAAMAGIGNVYSDEILFQARLHPRAPPSELDGRVVQKLHRQIRRVMTMAADRGADPQAMPRTWLLRHREHGVRCPRGNGEVEKHTIAGRGAFFCPDCQPQ